MSRMPALLLASMLLVSASAPVFAQDAAPAAADTCEAKAIDKNGKPLAGAAKAAFIKKCVGTAASSACAAKAVDKNGKALAGAAKASSIKKCEAEQKAAG